MAYNTSYIERSPSVQLDNVILPGETKMIFKQFLK